MYEEPLTLVSGSIDRLKKISQLSPILSSVGFVIEEYGANDLNVCGRIRFQIEFDKGITKVRAQTTQREEAIHDMRKLAGALSNYGLSYEIEVCDDDWQILEIFSHK